MKKKGSKPKGGDRKIGYGNYISEKRRAKAWSGFKEW
jgi:hypothetical protein